MTQPDYTGASAGKYIDSYTNRPQDAGDKKQVQGLLGYLGLIPGAGNPFDYINAGMYAAEGDWENAALYGSSMGLMGNKGFQKNIKRGLDAYSGGKSLFGDNSDKTG